MAEFRRTRAKKSKSVVDAPVLGVAWDVDVLDVDGVVDAASPPLVEDVIDVAAILSLEPPVLQEQSCKLHGLVVTWSAIVAALGKHMKLLRLARDVRGAQVREERRSLLLLRGAKTTEGMLEGAALQDAQYVALRRAKVDAEAEYERARGVLSAIHAKGRMAKALLFSMGDSTKMAVAHRSFERIDMSVDEKDFD